MTENEFLESAQGATSRPNLTEAIITENSNDEILDIILAFNQETNYEALLDSLVEKLMQLTNSDAGTLYILKGDELHFCIVKNKSLHINHTMSSLSSLPPVELNGENINNASAYAALKKRVVIIDDIYRDSRFNFSGPRNYDSITGYRTKSMLVLPLISYGKTEQRLVGVLQLINAKDRETDQVSSYDSIDISVFMALSKIAANILSNNVQAQELNQFDLLVAVTTEAIDERSSYSRNHTQNVSKYCRSFAEYLHLNFLPGDKYFFSETDINGIALAALLHDIGKIITPLEIMDKSDRLGNKIKDIRYRFVIRSHQLEISSLKGIISPENYIAEQTRLDNALAFIEKTNTATALSDEDIKQVAELASLTLLDPSGVNIPILNKNELDSLAIRFGTLTATEREIMQEHVIITARLLNKIPFVSDYKKVPTWAKNHHEFLDGTGYPNQLTGDDLDNGSRILTIIDIFDALIATDRPYKEGIAVEKSLDILRSMADEGKLDAELVNLFAKSKAWEK